MNFVDDYQDFPLLSRATIKLPARSRALLKVILKSTNLKEGGIPRISCGPGICSGECVTLNDKGVARILMINSMNKNIYLNVPPVELEEYDDFPSSFGSLKTAKDKQKEQARRLIEIKKIV